MRMTWNGVIPALTTPFRASGALDLRALATQCRSQIAHGASALVCCGSLGEAATLAFEEKVALAAACVKAAAGRVPVALGVAALSTREAVALARAGSRAGCAGLMVLPPYVYSTDWREMRAHVAAVLSATRRSCMLYNNPPAYKTDFTPEQVAELAGAHANLHAVKESSGDVRRITALVALLGERLEVLVGLDDAVVEGVRAGATGWIAGLVNAFPAESLALYEAARTGDGPRADALYAWFLPLLRLDAAPKFVQLIKWMQAREGCGAETVRAPRLALAADDLAHVKRVYAAARAARPTL